MGKWTNSGWIAVLLVGLAGKAVCATTVPLQISTEKAPAGGWAQIKIFATKPTAIASGHFVINLDATVFGAGPNVGLFGANADALGLASVLGSQVDIQF